MDFSNLSIDDDIIKEDNETNALENDTIEDDNDITNVLDNEANELENDTIEDESDITNQLDNDSVDVENETNELDHDTIELDNNTIELDDTTIELNDHTGEIDDSTVELNTDDFVSLNGALILINQPDDVITMDQESISPSDSMKNLQDEQNAHIESDEEFYNSYSRMRPWARPEFVIVLAAIMYLGKVYDEHVYSGFMEHFADYIDEDNDEMTYERVRAQFNYVQSHPDLVKELDEEAMCFLCFETGLFDK